MMKQIRSKVMTIANRLVKRGYLRSKAMQTAWRLLKSNQLSVKVAGVSLEARQAILKAICRTSPDRITVQLQREACNPYDSNAVAVVVSVSGQHYTVGYLPKAVAAVAALLMDHGIQLHADHFRVCGGWWDFQSYGARFCVSL